MTAMWDSSDPRLREANVRIHELSRGFREPAEYLCECGSRTCQATMITLQPSVFADVVALEGVLLVLPGHESPGMQTLRQGQGYVIVTKSEEPTGDEFGDDLMREAADKPVAVPAD
jgi:hypothetical protein